jgi:rubrerythrin
MLSSIYYSKHIEKHNQKIKYNKLSPIQKKYFLLCEDCFWMASTLRHTFDYPLNRYRKCPICKNKVEIFPIPKSY